MSERLVVTAVVKNGGRRLGRVMRKLARLRGPIGEVAFVLYENNSTDGTKEALAELGTEIPRFRAVSEDLSIEEQGSIARARHRSGAPCRIELIARARAIAQQGVLGEFGDWDQVLVIDPDLAFFALRDIERNVERVAEGGYDGLFANGLTKWLRYRDAFAFRSATHPFGPEFLGDYWWENSLRRIQARHGGREPLPVLSAFGGAALYSMKAFGSGRYRAIVDDSYLEAQAMIDLSKADPEELERASRDARPNTNYSLPVVCEHVAFNYMAARAGLGRFAMDPAWRLLFLD